MISESKGPNKGRGNRKGREENHKDRARQDFVHGYRGEANNYQVCKVRLNGSGRFVMATVLSSNKILTVSHIWQQEDLVEGQAFDLIFDNETYKFVFDPKLFVSFKNTDLVEITLVRHESSQKKGPPPFRNLKETAFVTTAQMDHVKFATLSRIGQGTCIAKSQKVDGLSHKDGLNTYNVSEGFIFTKVGGQGMCGLPYIFVDGPFIGKIAGIHVAGNGKDSSMLSIITKDDLFEPKENEIQVSVDDYQSESVKLDKRLILSGLQTCIPGSYEMGVNNVEGMELEVVSRKSTSQITGRDVEQLCPWVENKEQINEVKKELKENFEEVSFIKQIITAPNIKSVKLADMGIRSARPTKTALKKSEISERLSQFWPPTKVTPLLTNEDTRYKGGLNPVLDRVIYTGSIQMPKLETRSLNFVEVEMLHSYKRNLTKIIEHRELTIDEAIGGIPGILSSLNASTSPGWPFVLDAHKRGKKEFFEFRDGKLWVSDHLREMVRIKIEAIQAGDFGKHYWLTFTKDELLKQSKIDEGKTRLIFCNNLVDMIVMRVFYGTLIANFNQGSKMTPCCISQNAASRDMNEIYLYLSKVGERFVAGDYKDFDQRNSKEIEGKCYDLINNLTPVPSENIKRWMKQHETESEFLIGPHLVKFYSYQSSGGMFTTIKNCLHNEFCMRYCFHREFPFRFFDDEVRLKVHGDDHILSVSPRVDFNPLVIERRMKEIGCIYTSDIKGKELTSEYRTFDDISFLGCLPTLYRGAWVGRMKKEILLENPHWTRNSNLTLDQEIKAMVEFMSFYPKAEFDYYKSSLEMVLDRKLVGEDYDQETLREVVSNRTANSGMDFYSGFCAESGIERRTKDVPISSRTTGLVKFEEPNPKEGGLVLSNAVAHESAQSEMLTFQYGLNSSIPRYNIDWTSTQTQGQVIFSSPVPYGLLEGDALNIQNIPFESSYLQKPTLQISLQSTGVQFMQGILVGLFMPMANYPPTFPNVLQTEYVLVQPNVNTTATLEIPYRYTAEYLSRSTTSASLDNFGTFYLMVFSPLVSASEISSTTIALYTAWKGTQVKITRPLVDPATRARREAIKYGFISESGRERKTGLHFDNLAKDTVTEYRSEFWQWLGLVANIAQPIFQVFTSLASGASALSKGVQNKRAAGYDNTPFVMSIPAVQAYTNASKTVGPEPIVSMALHPHEFARHGSQIMGPHETNLEYLMEKENILASFYWKTSDSIDKTLYRVPLASLFYYPENSASGVVPEQEIGVGIGLLNEFFFYSADFEFTLRTAKTRFQAGRLAATMVYNDTAFNLTPDLVKNYPSTVLDYSEDIYVRKWVVPFNAKTEYLRTQDSTSYGCDKLGDMFITVRNQLIAPDTMPQDVHCILSVSFKNVSLAVPRNISAINWPAIELGRMRNGATDTSIANNHYRSAWFIPPPPETEFTSESGQDDIMEERDQIDEEITSPVAVLTETKSLHPTPSPYRFFVGKKFEAPVADLIELFRRFYAVSSNNFKEVGDTFVLPMLPFSPYMCLYGGWVGGIKARIHSTTGDSVTFVPALTGRNKGIPTLGMSSYFQNSEVLHNGGALEQLYTVTSDHAFLELGTPFYTHRTAHNTVQSAGVQGYDETIFSGFLVSNKTFVGSNTVLVAGADDFRPGIYRPPPTLKSRAFTITGSGSLIIPNYGPFAISTNKTTGQIEEG